ncbi:phosphate ABC transporter ATP-binding protein [Clostridium fallax]|uniref:Phosphate ABC transporter ATP-binding protein, PhoT family n=1 Tax=Clostridium fallax TaxID=1533 RepID=A0A1M4YSH8_9CLOT|nr:ATP-binding cassette domain-containing protein [Clostridium fallax]SHF08673.1 phosphate ABC transporter ATP-binding protein, PhoT family [Clostridium fallax]SQB06204.1 phosphate ABC transporter ATP-binding protein [Clostridium fallax]
MNGIIKIKNFSVKTNNKIILNKINLEIEENKITVILGPSGGGKTTLLKSINRMIEEENLFTEGEILLRNENIYNMPIQKVRREIGMVFQNPNPFPFSIYKNMVYGPEYFGEKNKKKLLNLVEEKLKKVSLYDEIEGDIKRSALKLSGGQQQRLCIARALTVNPKVLLLDEPCSALDQKNILNIENLLMELKEEYTIILVTHNLDQADRISDKKIYIENGEFIKTI